MQLFILLISIGIAVTLYFVYIRLTQLVVLMSDLVSLVAPRSEEYDKAQSAPTPAPTEEKAPKAP